MELEICSIQEQTEEDVKAGRVGITFTCHEISQNDDRTWHNKNGLNWINEYTQNNIESAKGMPIVVRYLDEEKTTISDHGRMENDENDGSVIFPDSETVGYCEEAWIEDVIRDNESKKLLFGKGYIFDQRHHNLVKFLREEKSKGNIIKGSIEISGKGKSKQILYEHGYGSRKTNGDLIIPRTPKVYDYSAICLLNHFVTPADDESEMIEINTKSTEVNSDDIKNNLNKEDINMPDKDVVIELNEKIVELNNKINELNSQLEEKNSEINKCKEETNACKEKETELNALLVEANKNLESQKVQISELNTEIEPLRQMKTNAENEKVKAEINAYFEVIKKEDGFSETELNSLQEFVEKCDLSGLKAKETEICVNKFKELKKAEKATTEVNSKDDNTLFFSTKVEVETNSTDTGAELFK